MAEAFILTPIHPSRFAIPDLVLSDPIAEDSVIFNTSSGMKFLNGYVCHATFNTDSAYDQLMSATEFASTNSPMTGPWHLHSTKSYTARTIPKTVMSPETLRESRKARNLCEICGKPNTECNGHIGYQK